MFDYSYNWLILGSNMSRSLQSLNDSVFSIVTDFAILLPDPKSGYVLYDVYNHCKMRGGILNVTRLGTWREDNGLAIILTDSKIIRRRDYHGLRAKSAGIVCPKFNEKCIICLAYKQRVYSHRYCIDRHT